MPYDNSNWTSGLGRMRHRARQAARAKGFTESFRSGLELNVAILLRTLKVDYAFESDTIPFIVPASEHTYTPDFRLTSRSGKTIYIETKGVMTKADRDKHLFLREQHPELDIRIIFSNPHTWDRKAKTRSYAKWADELGIIWSGKAQMKRALLDWVNE